MSRIPFIFLLVSSPAFAYDFLGYAWDVEDLPFTYEISSVGEDSVPESYPVEAVNSAFQEWIVNAPCADLAAEYGGLTDENTGELPDGINRVTFEDPADEKGAGVLAYAPCHQVNEVLKVIDGQQIRKINDCDIVYNDNVDFTSDEAIAEGLCTQESSMQAVTTHEVGHVWGFAHTCEDPANGGDPCFDPILLEATMFWQVGPCDSGPSTITEYDIENATALYGPRVKVACSNELEPGDPETIAIGNVPFELKCEAYLDGGNGELLTANWDWGDGTISDGLTGSHVYTEPGNYNLLATVEGEGDTCEEFTGTSRRQGYVRACGIPESVFTYEQQDGLTLKFLNDTDLSVYGCIFDVQWDIFDESGENIASLKAWEPQYTFPEAGEYRVVLNVGGPAGTGASELMIKVKGGVGCNTAGLGAGFGLSLSALTLLRRRRR